MHSADKQIEPESDRQLCLRLVAALSADPNNESLQDELRAARERKAARCAQRLFKQDDRDEILALVMTAYKLRIDDAYAAVGVIRGLNKQQIPEYSDEPWCQPEADLRRFVAAGAARGILPPWWTSGVTRNLVETPCILGYLLHRGAVEPCDLLENDGTGRQLQELRELGDAFEGPPRWGIDDRGGPRDRVAGREPLTGRCDGSVPCVRCRAGVSSVTRRGIGHVDLRNKQDREENKANLLYNGNATAIICPFCAVEGCCPICNGYIEAGVCGDCGHKPWLYKHVTSVQPQWAKLAAKLAAPLELPGMRWEAFGDMPKLVPGAATTADLAGFGLPNLSSHLWESRCPQMACHVEASHMFSAALQLLTKALGIPDLSDPSALGELREIFQRMSAVGAVGESTQVLSFAVGDSVLVHSLKAAQHNGSLGVVESALIDGRHAVALLASRATLKVKPANLRHAASDLLRAGAQLIGDAFIADEKSVVPVAGAFELLTLAMQRINELDNAAHGFALSAYVFNVAVCRLVASLSVANQGDARRHLARMSTDSAAQCRRYLDATIDAYEHCGKRGGRRETTQVETQELAVHRARLIFLRSHDKFTRLGDKDGGAADLDLAIVISANATYCDCRAPLRIAYGNHDGAQEDLEFVLKTAHGDNRYLPSTLFAYAALLGQKGARERALSVYTMALIAEKRHRYLFGRSAADRPVRPTSALEALAAWAHTTLSTAAQRSERLRMEVSDVISASELHNSVTALVVFEEHAREQECSAATFSVADVAIIHGLKAAQHNGSLGVVESALTDGRHVVALLPSRATLKVKPANLRHASEATVKAAQAANSTAASSSLEPPVWDSQTPMGKAQEQMAAFQKLISGAGQAPAADLDASRAAITACTDVAKNDASPTRDGDQTFVRAAMQSDPGMRLKEARNTGMDYNMFNLSAFARACAMGDLGTVEEALSHVSHGQPQARTELLERRELLLRFSPLMCCIAGAQRMQVVSASPEAAVCAANLHKLPVATGGMQHIAVARVLLDAGANPNAKDVAGFTPFHLACDKDVEAALQIGAMLALYGGDPNMKNRFGAAPLIDATQGRHLRAVQTLVEAGADPYLADDSCRALTPEDIRSDEYNKLPPEAIQLAAQTGMSRKALEKQWRASGKKSAGQGRTEAVTPFTLAVAFPDARQLFKLADIRRAEVQHPTCSAAGCLKPAPQSCNRCRRTWYCSAVCQKEHWKDGHKEACRAARGERVRFRVLYEHPTIDHLRKGYESQARGAFKPGHPHIMKIQLPMDSSMTTAADAPEHVAAYNRMRTAVFLIEKRENDAVQFDSLVQGIRENGLNGLKGYFTAFSVGSHEDPALPGIEIDLDLQCMMPPRPF